MSPSGSPFTANLRRLKDRSGKTWTVIGRESGIHTRQLYFYLSGAHEPSLANLRKLADYFGVAISYFEREH